MPPRLHACCDFTLRSEIALPFAGTGSGEPEVAIRYQAFAHNQNRVGERGGYGLWARAGANTFELRANAIAHYLVRNGNEILIDPYPGANEQDIRGVLLSTGFASLLLQRGFTVLHGGVVELDGEGIALLGNSGVGKSTLVSFLQRYGANVLSDELGAVKADAAGQLMVWPVFPTVSLCEDAYRRHEAALNQPHAVTVSSDKFHVAAERPATKPVALTRVIELRKARTGLSWRVLQGVNKLPALLRNTYLRASIADMGMAEAHLRQCVALAQQAEFREVTRPAEPVPEADFVAQLLASLASDRRPG